MKANEAPERIWINPATDLPKLSGHIGNDSVEYVRTDSVTEWLKNKADKYIVDTPLCSYFDYKRAVEDFKKAQKGE